MNRDPCVRLGIRISPKMSENPADSRNNRPPKVTLLTVSSSQDDMAIGFPRSFARERRASRQQCPPASLLLERRVVARIDRLRQELLLVVSPELADVVVGLYGFVPEAQTVLGALFAQLPDVEVANHVAEMIELDRAAWRVCQVDRPHRRHQLGFVAGVAVERLE